MYVVENDLKLHLEQDEDSMIHNMFYLSLKHDQYVGNVIIFSSKEFYKWKYHMHLEPCETLQKGDCGALCDRMQDTTELKVRKILVGLAFCRGNVN